MPVLTSGTLFFFCGYIEDYMLMHVALGGAILATLRYLNGRAQLIAPLALIILACLLHLSAVVLLPAWLIMMVMRLKSAGSRMTAFTVMGAAGVAAIALLMNYVHEGYGGTGALLPLFQSSAHAYTLFSPSHFHFLLNEVLLVLGGALLLPLAMGAGKKSGKPLALEMLRSGPHASTCQANARLCAKRRHTGRSPPVETRAPG